VLTHKSLTGIYTISVLINDTGLYFGLRVNRDDGFLKTFQTINAGNQYIHDTSLLHITDHSQPEVCSLTLGRVHPKYLFPSIFVNAQDIIHTARLRPALFLHLVKHGIQPYNAIQLFQRALLPFLYQRDYLV